MNLNAAALKLMAEKGLTLEDVAEIVAANEVTRDPTAAERQARYRARKQASRRNVTRNTPPNDKDILTPHEDPKPIGLPQPKKMDRGSRLPADWTLPDEWQEWAKERRNWSDGEVGEEALLFANYWQAKSGAGACHVNWFKTWQNWVIRSHRPDGNAPTRQATKAERIASLKENIAFYSKVGRTDDVEECRRKLAKLECGTIDLSEIGRAA